MKPILNAAIEAGGTKIMCAVGTGPDDLREVTRIPTTDPQTTLEAVAAALESAQQKHGRIHSIGIGTFGPAGVDPRAPDYGWITTTPKPGWGNTDVLGKLRSHFSVPMIFDTDVNAAALGEWKWGVAQGCDSVLYLTVGTGIGGGICLHGRQLHGMLHPEMGHIRVPHDRERDPFAGACPWHGDCLEGLASGFAMEQRWKTRGETLPPDHPAWDLQAYYLGTACANFILTLSPQRVILGGGVMSVPGLFEKVTAVTMEMLGGYLKSGNIGQIVRPGLGDRAGLCGALALAQLAHE